MLYEVVILEGPTPHEAEMEGALSKVVAGPILVNAQGAHGATAMAVKQANPEIADERMEIKIRKFMAE